MRNLAISALTVAERRPKSDLDAIRLGLAESGLDCKCQKVAQDLLDRIRSEQEMIRRTAGLADAVRMRNAIGSVLDLLDELDALLPNEPDRSAFNEIADLFEDIAELAIAGAAAARRTGWDM
ncbi:MAG: hypothetical protein H6883_11475 [Rhodobiaceae bacterium]|nr:hypothetical protein [Rhodobiaceae bacterium]